VLNEHLPCDETGSIGGKEDGEPFELRCEGLPSHGYVDRAEFLYSLIYLFRQLRVLRMAEVASVHSRGYRVHPDIVSYVLHRRILGEADDPRLRYPVARRDEIAFRLESCVRRDI